MFLIELKGSAFRLAQGAGRNLVEGCRTEGLALLLAVG